MSRTFYVLFLCTGNVYQHYHTNQFSEIKGGVLRVMPLTGVIFLVTMLAIILAGAAIVREREHGTMDHLLVLPLTPFEIATTPSTAR